MVAPLERLNIGLNSSEFILNDDQTLIDKVCCIDCDLILLSDNILIISLNQHVQDSRCSDWRGILKSQSED